MQPARRMKIGKWDFELLPVINDFPFTLSFRVKTVSHVQMISRFLLSKRENPIIEQNYTMSFTKFQI